MNISLLIVFTKEMLRKKKQSGITLTEMVVVIAIVAILATFGLPAARSLLKSFESGGSTKSIINAALSTARAIAAKEQCYAGIRFQRDLDENQYMIFIIQDPTMMMYGFKAYKGIKPIRLPDSIYVMDLTVVTGRNKQNPVDPNEEIRIDDPSLPPGLDKDTFVNESKEVCDTTTFSIVFSPTGRLIIHGIRVRNRDGFIDSASNLGISYDDVFNKKLQVDRKYNGYNINDNPPGAGMFYQDDYYNAAWPDLSLGPEPSRNSFVICEKDKFRQAYNNGRPWTDCLAQEAQNRIFINPYIGTIIESNL